MLIRVKMAELISIFSLKDAYQIFRQLSKEEEKSLRVLTRDAKIEIRQQLKACAART